MSRLNYVKLFENFNQSELTLVGKDHSDIIKALIYLKQNWDEVGGFLYPVETDGSMMKFRISNNDIVLSTGENIRQRIMGTGGGSRELFLNVGFFNYDGGELPKSESDINRINEILGREKTGCQIKKTNK